jgi:hypothetical protein
LPCCAALARAYRSHPPPKIHFDAQAVLDLFTLRSPQFVSHSKLLPVLSTGMEIPAEHLEVALGFAAANRYHSELVEPRALCPRRSAVRASPRVPRVTT